MKKIISLLFAVLLLVGLALTAQAQGLVTYQGDAQKFIFEPGTRHSPTNLFDEFQNVMPGDTLTQSIEIRNEGSANTPVRIYLRSLGAQKGTEDFLSQLQLKVAQGRSGTLADAPANEPAELSDWVLLGTFEPGSKTELQVTLEVPLALGNEYQHSIGYIDWEFMAEHVQPSTTEPVSPTPRPAEKGQGGGARTGDEANPMLYAALMCASGLVLAALYIERKMRKKA